MLISDRTISSPEAEVIYNNVDFSTADTNANQAACEIEFDHEYLSQDNKQKPPMYLNINEFLQNPPRVISVFKSK